MRDGGRREGGASPGSDAGRLLQASGRHLAGEVSGSSGDVGRSVVVCQSTPVDSDVVCVTLCMLSVRSSSSPSKEAGRWIGRGYALRGGWTVAPKTKWRQPTCTGSQLT